PSFIDRGCDKMYRRFAIAGAAAASLVGVSASLAGAMSVTPTSDSIVDSNALLYATNGSWGRAINREAFQADILISHDGYQYTAWYRNDADRSVMIARRTIDGANVGEWEVVDTGSALTRGIFDSNVHNVISIGISKNDGTL